MKVYAFESVDWIEANKRGLTQSAAIESVESGLKAVKELLPSLSEHLNIVVRPHFQHVMPEYGTGGYTYDSEFIEITFDKTIPFGVEHMLKSFYETVFHEGNHAARYNSTEFDGRFLNSIVTEGLATVFERDYVSYEPLYSKYEDDDTMQHWYKEVSEGDWDKRAELMFQHSDGRKWIGYKTGTWLIDTVMKRSGKTICELTVMPADAIIRIAEF